MARAPQRRPRQIRPRSQLLIDVTFRSDPILSQAQSRGRRPILASIDANLYFLDAVASFIGTDEAREKLLAICADHISTIEADIQTERDRIQAVADEAGVDLTAVTVADAVTVQIPITTPLSRRVINIAKATDDLVTQIDALWLLGAIQTGERNAAIDRIRDTVFQLMLYTGNLRTRALEAAKRADKEDQARAVESELGDATDDTSDAVPDDDTEADEVQAAE